MSFPLHPSQVQALREEARLLADSAQDHERRLEALIEAADAQVAHAEVALAAGIDGTRTCIDRLHHALTAQVQRSRDAAEAARQLSARGHQQHVGTLRLLRHLESEGCPGPGDQLARGAAVLVVDDYAEVRHLIAAVLRQEGFVVGTAANGLEALLLAYDMRPTVILMDVVMPVLDGIQATRLIKVAEATRHARVIAYTSDAEIEDGVARNWFAAVLKKPAAPATIVATVLQVASL